MCDDHELPEVDERPGRREVVRTLAAAPLLAALAPFSFVNRADAKVADVPVAPGLRIRPRAAWGADLPPKHSFAKETVKFLLVHHTASSNRRPKDGWRSVIRSAYSWQTSPAKGWADVCYHFFVDPDGVVWEGRAGSLAGPVVADATGGNQGFAQLVCMIGDFTHRMPTPAAQASLVKTLAWLAERYSISTAPGSTVGFVSRGSNRYRRGSRVTTATIAPHRAMTYTACPGDTFAPFVTKKLMAFVEAAR